MVGPLRALRALVEVYCPPWLAAPLAVALAAMRVDDAPAPPPEGDGELGIHRVTLTHRDGRLVLSVDDLVADVEVAAESAIERVMMEINRLAAASVADLVVLHAAAVAHEGRGVVLVGPSGSGKSSVAAAMVADGWAPLADEVVALGADGAVMPYAKPLALRSGAAAELEGALPLWRGEGLPVGHALVGTPPGAPPEAIPSVIAVVQYGEVEGGASPLRPAQTLFELVRACLPTHGDGIDFRRLGEVAARTPAVAIDFRSCRAAARILASIGSLGLGA